MLFLLGHTWILRLLRDLFAALLPVRGCRAVRVRRGLLLLQQLVGLDLCLRGGEPGRRLLQPACSASGTPGTIPRDVQTCYAVKIPIAVRLVGILRGRGDKLGVRGMLTRIVVALLLITSCGDGDRMDVGTDTRSLPDTRPTSSSFGLPCSTSTPGDCPDGLVCVGSARRGACRTYCSRSCAATACPSEWPVCDPDFEFCRPLPCERDDECEPGHRCLEGAEFAVDDRYCAPEVLCE